MSKLYYDINEGVLRNIGSGKKILDVGCGTGLLGEELKKQGNTVIGVDFSKEEVQEAKGRLDEVILADVTDMKDEIKDKFDVIIFSDVLEHLINPPQILQEFKKHLADAGEIIVSLPNIASWTTRFRLLFGYFDYRDYGIMDETHLRFYTLYSAKSLVETSGYEIKKIDVNPNILRAAIPIIRSISSFRHGNSESGDLDKAIIESRYYRIYKKILLPIELIPTRILKNLFAFQFIIIGKPINLNTTDG